MSLVAKAGPSLINSRSSPPPYLFMASTVPQVKGPFANMAGYAYPVYIH